MPKDISFFYIIKGILKKAEKSMIKNDRKTLRKKIGASCVFGCFGLLNDNDWFANRFVFE